MKFTKNINLFKEKKEKREKISMLTCYDYQMACILNETALDTILVGDSLGNVFQGNSTTLPVTVEDIIYHTKCVKRGAPDKFVVADLPFLSYHISPEEAVRNAGKIIKESGADAVKLEGGEGMVEAVKKIVIAQIPVMGHLGLTPQSVNIFGGFKAQGKTLDSARKLLKDAYLLEEAGAFAIVLECIPEEVAKIISDKLTIPTIGIGSGPYTDGQVLVLNDALGMSDRTPKFVKKFASLKEEAVKGIEGYLHEVSSVRYPTDEHSIKMKDEISEDLLEDRS